MKKLLYTTIACAVASLMLLSVSSCKREDGVEQPVENSLVLSVISDEVSTVRAEAEDDTLNENKIDKLDIFIYDAGILRWHIKPADMTLSGNSVTVPIKADKEILFHNNRSRGQNAFCPLPEYILSGVRKNSVVRQKILSLALWGANSLKKNHLSLFNRVKEEKILPSLQILGIKLLFVTIFSYICYESIVELNLTRYE